MPEYHIKSNGGRRMLTLEQVKDQVARKHGKSSWSELLYWGSSYNGFNYPDAIDDCMRIYRNQGIQQASEVCSEMLTDGFRISNVPAVLALKEEL